MKVLFDQNVPAADNGWEELKNGDLLRHAEIAGYQVMVTGDQSISYQQNLSGRSIALVVLSTNNWTLSSQTSIAWSRR